MIMNVLVIDVGGTTVKLGMNGKKVREFDSGNRLSAAEMCDGVLQRVNASAFDAVTIGYPGRLGPQGIILAEPEFLGSGWLGFDFTSAFRKPVRLINDAALQAVGAYRGGRMLFLGLGTGLDTCFIAGYVVFSLEVGNLPFKNGLSYGDYLAKRGLERMGFAEWAVSLEEAAPVLQDAFVADEIVLGGGHANLLASMPVVYRKANDNAAFVGGARLWDSYLPMFQLV